MVGMAASRPINMVRKEIVGVEAQQGLLPTHHPCP